MTNMNRYLNEEEFEGLRRRIEAGKASVSIPRGISRQFFTRVDNASIRSTTGRSLIAQKLVIWTGITVSAALLVVCCAAVIFYFGWFASLGVPLVGMFWTVIAGLTGDQGTWLHGAIGLVVGLCLAAILEIGYGVPLALFVVSLWLHRSNYGLAQRWLTQLISTSYGAFDMLVEHIEIDDPILSAAPAEQLQS
jgi:hypothetical protein